MPDIEANARKLAIDGSAAASLFDLQSPLGADALKNADLGVDKAETCTRVNAPMSVSLWPLLATYGHTLLWSYTTREAAGFHLRS